MSTSFLEKLRTQKEKDDRGFLAAVRCYLVEERRPRAWPAVARLGIRISEEWPDRVQAVVAALYATHPEEATGGNFGATCASIAKEQGDAKGDDKLSPTERRFQHLLASERHEICDRVRRFVLFAKAKGVAVHYEQLEKDLARWGERTKIEWAHAFWTPDAEPGDGEEA